MNEKKYLDADLARGFPVGGAIYYECLLCGGTIPSTPKHSVACRYRNVIVDVDAGRVAVKAPDSFRVYALMPDP